MSPRYLPVAALALAVAGCGAPAQGPATIALKFDTAAASGGDFVLDATDTVGGPCAVPDGMTRIRVLQFGDLVTETAQVDYDLEALGADCTLRFVIPTGAELRLTIEGFGDNGELVRKGITDLGLVPVDASLAVTTPMWPASRVTDVDAAEANTQSTGPDLVHVDIVRMLDRFTLDLVFAGSVAPATQRGPEAVAGSLHIHGPEGGYTVLLNSHSDGMPLVADGSNSLRAPLVPFAFERDRLRIQVPYSRIASGFDSEPGPVVDAPDIEVGVALVGPDGNPGDRLDPQADAP